MDWQTVGILALVFAAIFALVRFMPRGGGC